MMMIMMMMMIPEIANLLSCDFFRAYAGLDITFSCCRYYWGLNNVATVGDNQFLFTNTYR